jgi:hypothetical protein
MQKLEPDSLKTFSTALAGMLFRLQLLSSSHLVLPSSIFVKDKSRAGTSQADPI